LIFGGVMLATPVAAQASQLVIVRSTSAELEPLVGRLCAELATAGYAVTFQLSQPPMACERGNTEQGKTAWVTLAPNPADHDSAVATVCFDGTAVVVGGPKADSVRFVVSTAEALNGLSATPLAALPERRRAVPAQPRSTSTQPRPRHALAMGQTLIIDPAGFPALWGATLDAELALNRSMAIVLGGFFPIARAELSTPHAELRTGLTFLRVGPALRYSVARFTLAASLVAGPALTWVTARAVAPYAGRTDSVLGVFSGAGLVLTYPDRGPVFASIGSRASALLPGPRIRLPEQASMDLGPVLLEASLGIGLRL
jgi:hypothetical protein